MIRDDFRHPRSSPSALCPPLSLLTSKVRLVSGNIRGVLIRLLARKVAADHRYPTQTRHFMSIKNRLLVFQDLMSELIPDLVPARM